MKYRTHQAITAFSLEMIANDFCSFFRDEIIQASADEDYYKIGKIKIPNLGLSHFYNPNLDQGQFLNIFGNAKQRGVDCYNKAEKYFAQHNFEKAFTELGRSLHFLQDLASPSHVHVHSHYLLSDGFEKYVEDNLESIDLRIPGIPTGYKPADFFYLLAKETIHFEAESINNLSGKILYSVGKRKKLPKETLREQSEILIPMAISYSAGLLYFFAYNNFNKVHWTVPQGEMLIN